MECLGSAKLGARGKSFSEGKVFQGRLAEGKVFQGRPFPLALTPLQTTQAEKESKSCLLKLLSDNKEKVDELLLTYKALLFRGFKVDTAQDFHEVVEAIGYDSMEYSGGAAVRTQLTPRVFTANESPASEIIPYHHELAQTPHPPTHVFFFCETPPSTGGATPILPSSEICRRMTEKYPDFMHKLEHLGVRYKRVMPCEDDPTSAIGRGWKATFNCQSVEEAENELRKLGSDWTWLDDNCLRTVTAIVPGIRTDERTHEKTFFNSIVAAYTGWNDTRNIGSEAVVLADGSLCGESEIFDAKSIMSEIEVAFAWEQGDVLLLDNRTVMHSRQPFTGPRRILASLCRDSKR